MRDLTFSLATIEDVQDIVEINNSYVGLNDVGGFLVIHFDEHQIKQLLEIGEIQFFIAKNKEGELLGYAEVGDSLDHALLNDMTWNDDNQRKYTESILAGKYVYVKQLAVKKGHQRRGIASFIYRRIEEFVNCPVVAFAANIPKRNEPSMRFHEKHGFKNVSRLHRINFGEFTEYESILYIKKP